MKKNFCAASALLFVLSASVLAGDMHTGVVSPPPPPSVVSAPTEPDEITTGATETAVEFNSLVTEIALNLGQLLSVF